MRFPPSFLERLRSHFLMSEVIGRRITIKKHGREYHALCPFHNEKTPSFTINDEKGFFHCFGCAAHGDAIEFVKLYDRLTYPEAVEQLARDAGIALPTVSREDIKKAEQEKTLYDVLEASTVWFTQQLATAGGAAARDYLQKRGLLLETLSTFRIGYAPDDRTALHKHLTTLGFSQALQAEAGMIILPEGGGVPYDRFRARVMFPIRSASGKVVAFGGRLLAGNTNKNLPKYLNSPETPLFKKGEMLFNLDLAKKAAREKDCVVVMEGYMDVVSSAQAGIGYAVATLGTAVTPEHLRLLWQMVKEPTICLDGDVAGKRAMLRAAEIVLPLLKPGYSLRFAKLHKGEDPDSYVQKHGPKAFEQLIIASRRLSQRLWEEISPHYKLDLPEHRAALGDTLKKLSDKIEDQSIRKHYDSYFKNQLWEAIKKLSENTTQSNSKLSRGLNKKATDATRSSHVENVAMQRHLAPLEILVRRMLKTLLMFPQLLHKNEVHGVLQHMEITNSGLNDLRNTLFLSLTESNIDDYEIFKTYVHSKLPADLLVKMLNDSLNLPFSNTLTEEDAILLWNESAKAYQAAAVTLEHDKKAEDLGKNMNEAGLQGLVELQSVVKKANAERHVARAEDVA